MGCTMSLVLPMPSKAFKEGFGGTLGGILFLDIVDDPQIDISGE